MSFFKPLFCTRLTKRATAIHLVLCPWLKWKKVNSDRPVLNICPARVKAFFTPKVFAATLSQFATCIEAKNVKKLYKKISTPICDAYLISDCHVDQTN